MTRIGKTFRRLKSAEEKALVAYIMAGDPSLDATERLIYALEEGGADLIELGVPFSDPLADGPVIQRASERALAQRTNLVKVFNLVDRVRKRTEIPIIVMTYYNIIFNYGERSFVDDARRAGVDGVIIPDLPPEEGAELTLLARKGGLDMIFLLAPTSTERRISLITRKSQGFVYYVSLTGVTGTRKTLSDTIAPMTARIKAHTGKPVVVGFGVSTAEQALQVSTHADGVVIGSAIVRIIEENLGNDRMVDLVRDFVNGIKLGMRHHGKNFDKNTQLLGDYLSGKI